MKFEWDPVKDHLNQTKHGLGFEEAATAFGDQFGTQLGGSGALGRGVPDAHAGLH